MIQSYYRARVWDESGFIPEDKLRQLGVPLGALRQASAILP
jgi:aldehyde:ferredoxin oxidoreductase